MKSISESSCVRRAVAPLICGVTFAMPFVVWFESTGNPVAYLSASVPPGQMLYVLSKLCALLGIVMVWFQAMAALAKQTPALRGFPQLQRRHHIAFGIATCSVVLLHLTLFVAASTIRTKHTAFDLLLPTFEHGYYRAMVGLGAIAFWALVLAMLGGWRRIRGAARWRWLHRLVFLVFAVAFLHGITIGSETRYGLMAYVYAFMGLSLGTGVLSWMWQEVRRQCQRSFATDSHAGPVTATSAVRGE